MSDLKLELDEVKMSKSMMRVGNPFGKRYCAKIMIICESVVRLF